MDGKLHIIKLAQKTIYCVQQEQDLWSSEKKEILGYISRNSGLFGPVICLNEVPSVVLRD